MKSRKFIQKPIVDLVILQNPQKNIVVLVPVVNAIYQNKRNGIAVVAPQDIEELFTLLRKEDVIELANEIFKEENRYELSMK